MTYSSYKRRWRTKNQLFTETVPAGVLPWLFDPSSLTARLIRYCHDECGGRFNVRLLQQSMRTPTLGECAALGIRQRRSAIIREVKLYCGDTPLVYARSVIPNSTLTGKQRAYANLGSRPLGAMLFADKSMRREQVMVSSLRPGDDHYVNTGEIDKAVWGRRSIFYVGGKPLLVSEYFLPSLVGNR